VAGFSLETIMRVRCLAIICSFTATLSAGAAHAGATRDSAPALHVGHMVPGAPGVAVRIKSMRDLRYTNMVRQQRDFTCGAAALATVLQQMYGRATTEQEIIQDMLANTDANLVRERGFSLLDMKNYLERVGLRGRGYRIDGNTLLTLKIPVIALQTTRGYAHFVVVKRVDGDMVYIADPALGHRQMRLDEFVAGWNGIVFAVLGDGRKASNTLVESARSLGSAQRAGIVTRSVPPQQEFGLFGMDTF
jgi:predicted double-glycine peptidase